MDSNHTHFILVDDGSENRAGKAIEFRVALEHELRKGKTLKYYERHETFLTPDYLRSVSSAADWDSPIKDPSRIDFSTDETIPTVFIVVNGGVKHIEIGFNVT